MNDFNRLISQHKTSSCKTLTNSYLNFSQQDKKNSTAQSVAIIVLKGGFSPDFCENTILRYELAMMARTCTNNLRVVLSP